MKEKSRHLCSLPSNTFKRATYRDRCPQKSHFRSSAQGGIYFQHATPWLCSKSCLGMTKTLAPHWGNCHIPYTDLLASNHTLQHAEPDYKTDLILVVSTPFCTQTTSCANWHKPVRYSFRGTHEVLACTWSSPVQWSIPDFDWWSGLMTDLIASTELLAMRIIWSSVGNTNSAIILCT